MKPKTILLAAEDGGTLVTDFGIARLMRDDRTSTTDDEPAHQRGWLHWRA